MIALALFSSLLWGTSDFLGGTAARWRPVLTVVAATQLSAAAIAVVGVLALGEWRWGVPALGWGGAAGAIGLIGLVAFYRALATGTMGVVAPVAATGAAVPLLAGVARSGSPGAAALLGAVLACAGIVVAVRVPDADARRGGRLPVALAGLAAIAFGTVFVLLRIGEESSVGMTLVAQRIVGATLATSALSLRAWRSPGAVGGSWARRDGWLPVTGGIDLAANTSYLLAARGGHLAVVGVLSSLYPLATVGWARLLHRERLYRAQAVGIAAVLLGVVLMSA